MLDHWWWWVVVMVASSSSSSNIMTHNIASVSWNLFLVEGLLNWHIYWVSSAQWLGEIVLVYIATIPSSPAIFGKQDVFNPLTTNLLCVCVCVCWNWSQYLIQVPDPGLGKHMRDSLELFHNEFSSFSHKLTKFIKITDNSFQLPVIIYSGYLQVHLWEKKSSWIPWVMAFA